MKTIGYVGLAWVLSLALAVPALSQQAAGNELADYTAFYNEQNPQTKAQLGEKFLTDYPQGTEQYRKDSYLLLFRAFEASQNWAKVMEYADKYAAESFADNASKAANFTRAMTAAQQTGNFDKIVEYGDKTLAIDPNNLNAQLVLSAMIPERLPADEAGKTAALAKAMDLGTKAHDQVEALFKGAKPENFSDADWAEQKRVLEGQVHATLGLIHYHKAEYDESVFMYEYVVELNPKDQRAQFLLGLGYNYQSADAGRLLLDAINAENEAKAARADQIRLDELVFARTAIDDDYKAKRDKAIDALARAVALPDAGFTAPARDQLERIYRNKNNDSLEGLDALIAQKRSELGV